MEARELMVGDWVQLVGTPHRLTLKDMESICFNEENKLERTEFEPIRITHEILEKNGFYLMDKTYWMNHFAFPFAIVLNDGRFECNILDWSDSDNDIYVFYIKYVHELQHALKLCRIKKEIEL